ncbi:hypothetical protein DXG01_001136 [Tephrocybe rancida]|nr:hypothetical protein DXG01_001136 [Tephrocybe rancida]
MHCVRTPQNHSWTVAHMRRSKKCMVRLYLYASRALTSAEIQYMFVTYGDRIQMLRALCSNSLLTRTLWQQFHDHMPLLERYEFSTNRDIIMCAARDRSIEPHPFPFPLIFKSTDLSWAEWSETGLTVLILKWINREDRLPLDDLGKALSTCSSTLRIFEFAGVSPSAPAPDTVILPIRLPVLEQLSLAYANSFVPLAQLIDAPNLKCLSLCDLYQCPHEERPFPNLSLYNDLVSADPTDVVMILELYHRIPLLAFKISGERSSLLPTAFRDFLLLQTKLRYLSIYGCSEKYHKAVLDSTIPTKDMLPELNELQIVSKRHIADKVLGFLRRRMVSKLAPLRKLTIASRDEPYLLLERELFMGTAVTHSVVSDPVSQVYIPFDEKTILSRGLPVAIPTPPASPVLDHMTPILSD